MCSNLIYYQLETDGYIQRLLYVILMVTIKQKPTAYTEKVMRNESKHNTTEIHHLTKEEIKRKEQRGMTKQLENN